jgi:hypothetical protein
MREKCFLFDFHFGTIRVRERYVIGDCKGALLPYSNFFISKFPMAFAETRLYENDPKSFIVCRTMVNGRRLCLGIVHLKSGNCKEFGDIRRREISETLKGLMEEEADDFFLMGDFNFKDIENEKNEELDSFFQDSWLVVYGESKRGFTHDLELNDLGKAMSDRIDQVKGTKGSNSRFDRILFRSNRWKPKQVHLFGTEPVYVSPEGKRVFPSDHFGLCSTFVFSP